MWQRLSRRLWEPVCERRGQLGGEGEGEGTAYREERRLSRVEASFGGGLMVRRGRLVLLQVEGSSLRALKRPPWSRRPGERP